MELDVCMTIVYDCFGKPLIWLLFDFQRVFPSSLFLVFRLAIECRCHVYIPTGNLFNPFFNILEENLCFREYIYFSSDVKLCLRLENILDIDTPQLRYFVVYNNLRLQGHFSSYPIILVILGLIDNFLFLFFADYDMKRKFELIRWTCVTHSMIIVTFVLL